MTTVLVDDGRRAAPSPELRARPSATGTDRIVALDGLRAVALLIIMGYHFGVGWLGGGFFSLDIFYVLSGYLITGLLLGEYRKRGRITLSAFWLRRARRLLPALAIVLVATTVLVRFAAAPGLYPDFRLSALSALFYFSNWWQIAAAGNYFVATGAVSPLTHTWSLAVEEQFYLVWPLVALAVLHFARTFARGVKALLVVSAVGALASAVEMVLLYHPGVNITRLYFGTDTHAQSILIGATLACVLTMVQMRRGQAGMAPEATGRRARSVLLALGGAGFVGTFALTYTLGGTAAFDYRGGFTLSALSAAAIIVAAVCVPSGPLARGLAAGPLVWLGTISYGAYLWHYPVYIFLDSQRTGLTGLWLLALRFVATFCAAAVSYHLVERPIMVGTFWRSLRAVGPATALVVASVAVVIAGTSAEAAALPTFRQSQLSSGRVGGPTVPVLITGDSTALTLGLSLAYEAEFSKDGIRFIDDAIRGCGVAEGRLAESDGLIGALPAACNPHAPAADQWPSILRAEIRRDRPKAVVLLAGRWEVDNRTDLAGRLTNITDPAYAQYVKKQLELFVRIATSAGAPAVLMTAPYYSPGEQANGMPLPEDDPVRIRDYNRLVVQVASEDVRPTSLIDLNELVCPNGRFTQTIGNVVVRAPDGTHFPFANVFDPTAADPDTVAQVKQFSGWIGPQVLPTIVRAVHDG